MRRMGLHARVNLVLGSLVASLLLLLILGWLHGTRNSIHEEVETATRVAVPLINAMTQQRPFERAEDVIAVVSPLGRVRANELTVTDAEGRLIYRSPPPTYKAGKRAPAWFAGLLDSELPVREIKVGQFAVQLAPDPSRAVLDAWDELLALGGWALLLLGALWAGSRFALRHALSPLDAERAFHQRLQARLSEERLDISRELHDELAQGITAVRALAGAIAQRTVDQPTLHGHAQSVIAVTTGMQEGVKHILHRLRSPLETEPLAQRLNACLDVWARQHDGIELQREFEIEEAMVSAEQGAALIRIVQEALTNITRHASAATLVRIQMAAGPKGISLSLSDNGSGQSAGPSAEAGSGLGLAGMAERVRALDGSIRFVEPVQGGFGLEVRFPCDKAFIE